MPRKKKVEENKSISLFSDNDIVKTKGKKAEVKPPKTKKKNDNKGSNTSNSNNKSNITNKINKDDKSTSKSTSTKRRNSTKVDDKSKSNSRKNSKADKNTRIVIETNAEPKIKVGRRDRKHNYIAGFDQVWVDGIDHWVSKTAFRNDDKTKNPVYTLDNYVQGLDSYWVLFHHKPTIIESESDKQLENLNKELKKKYKSWNEASSNYNLSENLVEKYKDYIYWLVFLKSADINNRNFSDKFRKKYKDKFLTYLVIK